jgi:hypothetical protein
LGIENPVHAIPGEIRRHLPESGFHPVQVEIMPKPGFRGDVGNSGLVWINFPRMEVKNTRLVVHFVNTAHHPARQRIGEEAKETTAAARAVRLPKADCRDWKFDDAVVALGPVRRVKPKPRRVGHTV